MPAALQMQVHAALGGCPPCLLKMLMSPGSSKSRKEMGEASRTRLDCGCAAVRPRGRARARDGASRRAARRRALPVRAAAAAYAAGAAAASSCCWRGRAADTARVARGSAGRRTVCPNASHPSTNAPPSRRRASALGHDPKAPAAVRYSGHRGACALAQAPRRTQRRLGALAPFCPPHSPANGSATAAPQRGTFGRHRRAATVAAAAAAPGAN
eukprot:85850-Chlamydomonas_euryale.AAC.1